MLNGVPQVWEVNLNPTMGRASGKQKHLPDPALEVLREQGRETVHGRMRAAFVALDDDADESVRAVTIPSALLARSAAEEAKNARRRRALSRLRDVYDHPRLGLPARVIYSKLFPRR